MATHMAPNASIAFQSWADGVERDSSSEHFSEDTSEHIVIGVDIGYTRTGVAICSTEGKPNESISPIPIQKWPGSDTAGCKITSKVPTLVAYRAADFRVRSWGYACHQGKPRSETTVGLFKFLLDEKFLEDVNRMKPEDDERQVIGNVRKWFTDFLTELYKYIESYLESPDWHVDRYSTKIEYIFSLPTSWEYNVKLIEDYREIIGQAGFGSKKNSSVTIGLTEGVASAVYTAKSVKHKFNEDDILLVCDAGGGTTDICVLRVVKIEGKTVELETIGQPTSIFVGSVQIDEAFIESFEEKLKVFRREQPDSLQGFVVQDHEAQDAARAQFQNLKERCGTEYAPRTTKILVPGIPENSNLGAEFLDDAIVESLHARVEFSRKEIEAMFDKQIHQIIIEIDKTLEHLQQMQPGLKVSSLVLVLAGGLGSSAYVQSELRTYYNPRKMQILVDEGPQEPPLSVCKGLVLDRMQRLLYGTSVLRNRHCRVSYGIVLNEVYKKNVHKDREIFIGPADGRKYVKRIQWFIKKGYNISDDPIRLDRTRIASFENPDTTWEDIIVTSKLPHDCLPEYLRQGDSRVVCQILSSSELGRLTSKRRYLALGRKYLRGEYEMIVFIEQENLRFETRVNGVKAGEGQITQVPWEYT